MNLLNFLRKLVKEDGFELVDANSKSYIIGKPKKAIPIRLKILDKSYNNILPPLSILNNKDLQKLIEDLKKIDFNYKN